MTQQRDDSQPDLEPENNDEPVITRMTEPPSDDAPPGEVAAHIEDLPAADGADVLRELDSDHAADVVEYLDPVTAGQIMTEMDPALAATVIADMEPAEASMVLGEMNPDDRVDILQYVPKPLRDQLIEEMDPAEAAEVYALAQYPPDTAGGIMTTEVTALNENLTVEQAISELRRLSEELEQMYYVYVVDQRQHLVGVVSMRDLILAQPGTPLNRIMRTTVDAVRTDQDQEEVANLMRRNGYLALPVTDERNRLVGLITVDDVVDVLEEEATEDVQKLFGAGGEERLTSTWFFSFRKRVGWSIVNLGTAFVASSVIGAFESTIERLAILAAYMPIVAGLGGNASAQAMAVTIRGIAVTPINRKLLRHVLRREATVGLLNGTLLGLLTAFIAILAHWTDMVNNDSIRFGMVIGFALAANMTLGCIIGSAIPLLMRRLGFDPAQSATIFATGTTDAAGFFMLLMLARTLLM